MLPPPPHIVTLTATTRGAEMLRLIERLSSMQENYTSTLEEDVKEVYAGDQYTLAEFNNLTTPRQEDIKRKKRRTSTMFDIQLALVGSWGLYIFDNVGCTKWAPSWWTSLVGMLVLPHGLHGIHGFYGTLRFMKEAGEA